MSNLIDIQNQIEKLQKQADDIKSKEFHKTVRDIVSTMRAFGITTKDLQSAGSRSKVKPGPVSGGAKVKSKRSVVGTVAPKYRGPGGDTWSGRGLTPRWLATLLTEGSKKEDFVIKN